MTQSEDKNKSSNRSLAGRLLVAMPSLGDSRFDRAVILVCHHDENGAMGLVINHSLPGLDLSQLFGQFKIEPSEDGKKVAGAVPVLSGGPVESGRGFILHSTEYKQSDTIQIAGRFGVTGTVDALRAIADGGGPEKMLFILGYAGWGEGQLDKELQDNAWLITEADPELIFKPDPTIKWESAIRTLGIDPAMLSADAGHA